MIPTNRSIPRIPERPRSSPSSRSSSSPSIRGRDTMSSPELPEANLPQAKPSADTNEDERTNGAGDFHEHEASRAALLRARPPQRWSEEPEPWTPVQISRASIVGHESEAPRRVVVIAAVHENKKRKTKTEAARRRHFFNFRNP